MPMRQFLRSQLVWFLLFVPALNAQLTRGYISGTVQDASGAVLPEATVRIISSETNLAREIRTSDVGLFRFVAVEPGTYTVEVMHAGFETKRIVNMVVGTGQEVTINPSLNIRPDMSMIEVTEAAVSVELSKSTATLQRTIQGDLMKSLPIFSSTQDRDVTRLAILAPTVNRVTGANGIAANGQRGRNNNFTIDGVDNNEISVTTASSRVVPEAVQELQIQTSSYSAEYGHSTGAQLNVITRAGTNQFHGEAYDYYNGNWMQPNNLLNKRVGILNTPRFDQNEAGGALGGPVIRNRTFFFSLVETNRFRQAPDARNATQITIPTPSGYAALQNVPLGAGETPEARQAVLKSISFFPDLYPTLHFNTALTSQTVNGVPIQLGSARIPIAQPFDYWYYHGRVDQIFSARDTFTYRYQIDKRELPNTASYLGFGTRFSAASTVLAQNHAFSETHTFAPALVNEFRFAYTYRKLAFPENDPNDPSTTVTNLFGLGGSSNFPQGRVQNEFQFQDVATWTRGRHSIKMGADIRYNKLFNQADFDSKGTFTFNNLQDFVNSSPVSLIEAVNTASAEARQTSQAYFVQDDWKANRNLTVNIGLRYEYANVPFGLFGAANDMIAAAGVPRNVRPDKNNFGPRLGFAYSPSPSDGLWRTILGDGQTVIRGGFSIAYDVLFFNILTVNASNPPRVTKLEVDTPAANNVYPGLQPKVANPVFSPLANFVNSPADTQNPTTQLYSLSIQRQFSKFILEAGYTGSWSYHQIRQGDTNPGVLTQAQANAVLAAKSTTAIPSLQARRVNPAWGDRTTIEATGIGRYNAGFIRLDKQLSHGLLVGGNYTYSSLLSDNDESLGVAGVANVSPQVPQNYFNYKPDYARSTFDRPNRVAVYYTYDVPWGSGGLWDNKALRGIFKGWQVGGTVEFQSGQPFTIVTGVDTVGQGTNAASRPDSNPGGIFLKDPVSGDLRTFTSPLVGGVFVTPLGNNGLPLANSEPFGGNLGKNTLRSPGYSNWNFSLAKTVNITERLKIQLRCDWTDFLNHENYAPPQNSMNSPVFGTNTSNPGTRSGFLAAKVLF